LVEHALCPLDPQVSLAENLIHRTEFRYFDRQRHARRGAVVVRASLGLSALDELFLWGMLGLTFAEAKPCSELWATPHFVLRQLRLIDASQNRGGRNYQQFRDALRRLSAVHYESSAFYDPIRQEHRHVAFGLLSFSLPHDPKSSRAWRIVWDPLFFEFCQVAGGRLFFDMDTYRTLDQTSRRLFLYLSKIFWRRSETGWIDLALLGYEVLGVARTVAVTDIKAHQLPRAMVRLREIGVLADVELTKCFRKVRKGVHEVQFTRGQLNPRAKPNRFDASHSALVDLLQQLGLTDSQVTLVGRRYATRTVREWIDITMAARERFGATFFRKGPAAYLLDNLKHVAAGQRTPPDWWHALRKEEQRREASDQIARDRPSSSRHATANAIRERLETEASHQLADIVRDAFQAVSDPGDAHAAKRDSLRAICEHLVRKTSLKR
jgi:hypothetical protein